MVILPEQYYKEMEEEGIHCIPANKFKPVLSRIHNNRDHRKTTVIDGKVGFTGGVNLADEYINETIGKNVYLNIIHAAREYLYLTTLYLICDHELMGALKLAAKRGVDVRLVTPHIPDKKLIFLMTRSGYGELIGRGVKIYEYTLGFVHAKSMICDDQFAICGTINLDYRSLAHHFKCAAWMYHVDCTADMKKDFMEIFSASEQITEKEAKLKPWFSLPAEVLKIFASLLL